MLLLRSPLVLFLLMQVAHRTSAMGTALRRTVEEQDAALARALQDEEDRNFHHMLASGNMRADRNENRNRPTSVAALPRASTRATSRRGVRRVQRGSLTQQLQDSVIALTKCVVAGYLIVWYCKTFLFEIR
ncbi:hypothetical protein MJO29_009438 [Puccinia striiformis f. sp. tritici]|nr:hypothetical protein Pst134EB_018404 [Puccinia striiformis f. sp. tritici]KAI7950764.1 hypothetical protein MJO29_009438 [Puccinia striiformis f. sp. tritici]